jgi:hypothetical protein
MPRTIPQETGLRVLSSLLVFLVALFLVSVAGAASAEPLAVSGVAGYLSEWQLSGNVTETPTGGEFIGRLAVRHIGLCSHDGPDEKVTEIKLRMTGAKPASQASSSQASSSQVPWSQLQATFTMDGVTCSLGGRFSGTYTGFMDCADTKGVPVTLSLK